ncbi:MAG: PQQ-binding-like beta-propeller repeat protein [Dehalococcoidia bacterium]|nr:PQQ-binding-like beta-propeller repeat protein [Dehalococcoidia bacterium]
MDAALAILPGDQQRAAQTAQLATTPSVRTLNVGMSGSITGELVGADLTGDGDTEVLFPTSAGLYILSGSDVILHIPTSSAVTGIALVDDLSGNEAPEVVLVVGDVFFPNVRAYDTATGEKLWDYVPAQEVFIDNLMWTEQQTQTYDLEAVDLNSDEILDIAVTSGYLVHAIDGRSGDRLWTFEALDNVWKVVAAPDIDGDGVADLVVGGQDGVLRALSGSDGTRLWERKLVGSYAPLDEEGERKQSVDRSVFDILPVDNGSDRAAIVTAEDGTARLIDLDDGTVV